MIYSDEMVSPVTGEKMHNSNTSFSIGDLKDSVHMGMRHKWTFLLISLVLFAGLTQYVIHLTPIYKATALVDVSPVPSLALSDIKGHSESASDPILIRTEVDVLSSDQLARRVIQQLKLEKNQTFSKVPAGYVAILRNIASKFELTAMRPSGSKSNGVDSEARLDSLVQRYHSQVSILNDGRSTIATITVMSADPSLAADIANAHARAYLKNRLERKLENTDVSDIKLISEAGVPSLPVYPRTGLLILVSLIASLSAGCVGAFVAGRLSSWAGDLQLVSESLGLRPLVSIPIFLNKKRRNALYVAVFNDRIRELRNILLRDASIRSTVVVVTSSLPQEGKSIVSRALAESMASASCRTLLIDADLRNPSLALPGAIENGELGLEAVLAGSSSFLAAIRPGVFDLLPAFRIAEPPIEALVGEEMKQLLGMARMEYSYIFIDTPPLSAVSEAYTLASLADQTIFLFKGKRLSINLLSINVSKLRAAGANVIGLIHTGVTNSDLNIMSDKGVRDYYY